MNITSVFYGFIVFWSLAILIFGTHAVSANIIKKTEKKITAMEISADKKAVKRDKTNLKRDEMKKDAMQIRKDKTKLSRDEAKLSKHEADFRLGK